MNSPSLGQVVAQRIRHYRSQAKISQQQLAERVSDLGLPMSRLTVNRIEALPQPRQITLEETLVIAAALGVPPLLLFLPLGVESTFRIGNTEVHPAFARKWLIGVSPFARPHEPGGPLFAYSGLSSWRANVYPLHAFEELSHLTDALNQARNQLHTFLSMTEHPAFMEHSKQRKAQRDQAKAAGAERMPLPEPFALTDGILASVAAQGVEGGALVNAYDRALCALSDHIVEMTQQGLVVDQSLVTQSARLRMRSLQLPAFDALKGEDDQ